MSNVASIYSILGAHKAAVLLLEKSIEIHSELFGKRNYTLAICQASLAQELVFLDDFDKAKTLLEEAIEVLKISLDKNDVAIVLREMELALIYDKLGEKEKSIELFQTALKIYSNYRGDNHQYTKIFSELLGKMKTNK